MNDASDEKREPGEGRRGPPADLPPLPDDALIILPVPSTHEKIAFLRSPAAYPDPPPRVELRETHMSWVFLAGDVVYKLKKPVRSAVLDFSTIAAREANCRAEVRLNRRLAPDVYEAVVALTLETDGRLALGGTGRATDWLVKMRRLPADRLLDHVIAHGSVSRTDIERVAALLASFYRRAAVADLTPEDYVARFAHEHAENESVLAMPQFDLPRTTVRTVLEAIGRFIAEEPQMLGERVRSGLVVEGHGDLKPEHICLLQTPVVIDCLEFNRALRLVDPYDELALLGLECDRLGAGWVGELITRRCRIALGSPPPDRLSAFHTAWRAALRARLVIGHLLDPEPREPEKWPPLARQYLAIAERESVRIFPRGARRSSRPRGSA